MAKDNKKGGNNVISQLSLITQFSLFMIVPIAGLSALGYFLDKKLGTNWIVIVGFFLGAIAGGNSIYRFGMKLAAKKKDEKEQNIINRRSETPNEAVPKDKKQNNA